MGPALRTAFTSLVLSLALPAHAAPWSYRVVGGELTEEKGRARSGETGAVVVLDEAVTVRVRPATTIRFDRKYARLQLDRGTRLSTFVLELVRGGLEVENRTTGPARRGVLVHAPHDFAAMISTGRLQVATTDTRSAAANDEGTAWVVAKGKSHALAPGFAYSSSAAVPSPYPLATPPSLDGKRHAFSGIAGPASIDGLSWTAVDGADRYVVRLERPSDPDPIATSEVTGTSQRAAFPPVPAGAYQARVAAIDDQGIEGAASRPLALHVVGAELGAGSYAGEDGRIFVAPGERVALSHVEGVVATFGRADGWIPAPSLVKLFRGEETVVRLKDARDTDPFEVHLAPRRFAVRVSAGPKRVQWPGEPVRITIDSSEARGAPTPNAVEIRAVVHVGVDPVPVEFHREGDLLTAELLPPPGPSRGPWVVRVDVADQFGHELGRDFVEVGVRPPPKTPATGTDSAAVGTRYREPRSTAGLTAIRDAR